MDAAATKFLSLSEKFTSADPDVIPGKIMMSSPGLKYRDKVFAFQHKNEMGFRLGPLFDPVKFGLLQVKPLSPFKSKPPLKGWFMVDEIESEQWELLGSMALEFTKTMK